MHRRCCCPPDIPRADFLSLSFASSQIAASLRVVKLRFGFDAVSARAKSDIVVNTHRKRIRLLKYHAYSLAQKIYIHIAVDIFSVQSNLTGDLASFDKVVHPVETLKKSRFSAAGRAYKGRDLILLHSQIYIFKGLKIAVIQVEILYFNFVHYFCHLPIF